MDKQNNDSSNAISGIMAKIASLRGGNGHQQVSPVGAPVEQVAKQPLEQFIEGLIDERKYPDLLPEAKEEMKKDLLIRLDDFIAARIIAALSDTDVLAYEKLLQEKKPEEEVQQFVSSKIPDFVNFLSAAMLEFRAVYLGIIPTNPQQQQIPEEKESLTPPPPPPPPAPVMVSDVVN